MIYGAERLLMPPSLTILVALAPKLKPLQIDITSRIQLPGKTRELAYEDGVEIKRVPGTNVYQVKDQDDDKRKIQDIYDSITLERMGEEDLFKIPFTINYCKVEGSSSFDYELRNKTLLNKLKRTRTAADYNKKTLLLAEYANGIMPKHLEGISDLYDIAKSTKGILMCDVHDENFLNKMTKMSPVLDSAESVNKLDNDLFRKPISVYNSKKTGYNIAYW